jgi:hypothetical protein
MRRMLCLFLLLTFSSDAWAQKVIRVTDPAGNEIDIATSAIVKLRPYKGGCVLYLGGSGQHVKESCAAVLKLMREPNHENSH